MNWKSAVPHFFGTPGIQSVPVLVVPPKRVVWKTRTEFLPSTDPPCSKQLLYCLAFSAHTTFVIHFVCRVLLSSLFETFWCTYIPISNLRFSFTKSVHSNYTFYYISTIIIFIDTLQWLYWYIGVNIFTFKQSQIVFTQNIHNDHFVVQRLIQK